MGKTGRTVEVGFLSSTGGVQLQLTLHSSQTRVAWSAESAWGSSSSTLPGAGRSWAAGDAPCAYSRLRTLWLGKCVSSITPMLPFLPETGSGGAAALLFQSIAIPVWGRHREPFPATPLQSGTGRFAWILWGKVWRTGERGWL